MFKSIKVDRKGTECIARAGFYFVSSKELCQLGNGRNYLISGTPTSSLPDQLLGRIWLDEPQIKLSLLADNESGGIPSGLMDAVAGFRSKLVAIAGFDLPEPESALVLGIVLGFKGSLSNEFYQALVNSGTLHMVVASGYNVMMVAGLALSAFLFVSRRRTATLLSIAVLFFYVLLTGGEVSILRAALMGVVVFLSMVLGRGSVGWWSLLLVIWAMVMADPLVLVNISFQLSATATFGVVILAPHISRRVTENSAVLSLPLEKLDLSTSVAALLSTWPVIWFHFGRGSVVSLVSNSLILPLVPLLMASGALMLVSGLIFAPLGLVLAWPTYALAHLVVILVGWFGGL